MVSHVSVVYDSLNLCRKGSEEAQTGWVSEDIYQDWNSDLQKMIKNFFLKYG